MPIAKLDTLTRIIGSGLVVVIRGDSADDAVRVADACVAGGAAALEVTFTVPGAARIIEELAKKYPVKDVVVGAGTVLDPETARIAILSGARFVMSPALNVATARLCNRYQVPHAPGAGSVRDVIDALESGADLVKIFPGEVLGPAFIRAVTGPLPQASMVPTGGVDLDNVAEWIAAGAVAVGVGSKLTAGARRGDHARVTADTREFLEKIRQARGK
ncbi:MAG: bifunctional 2-keto-4-hydroxyglutarate aldolase/2-keto-3-deoxy-6-phosphogluconate aldolase [Acidobacteriota bacterium]